MKRLPGTGQTKSYTNTFGEDADYTINPPFYILNGNGTITDTVTGLMWQKTDGGEMTVENAQIYCDSLTLAGYTDWRMPTCHELYSILNHDRTNPATDTMYFTKTAAEYWWSSQKQMNDASKIWAANAGGGVGNHPKSETKSAGGTKNFHVRAVRDVLQPTVLPNHFQNNGNGTTTDLLTGLTWLQVPLTDTLTWENALIASESLSFAGFTDWRLPDVKEIQSINDESLINPSVNSTYFSGVKANKNYWASTTLPNQTAQAWYLNTQFGITTYALKTSRQNVLCVRGGTSTSGIIPATSSHNSIRIEPNPSHGFISLISEQKMQSITISDITGRIILQADPDDMSFQTDLPLPGMYYVAVNTSSGTVTKKVFVVNHL